MITEHTILGDLELIAHISEIGLRATYGGSFHLGMCTVWSDGKPTYLAPLLESALELWLVGEGFDDQRFFYGPAVGLLVRRRSELHGSRGCLGVQTKLEALARLVRQVIESKQKEAQNV